MQAKLIVACLTGVLLKRGKAVANRSSALLEGSVFIGSVCQRSPYQLQVDRHPSNARITELGEADKTRRES